MAGFLIVNPKAGDTKPTAEELVRAAERAGVGVHVLEDGDDAAAIARSTDATVLGVAGGDGSLASVATVAMERQIPFVCIPFGTRNHFARDLCIDRDDPIGALDAFQGSERQIDVGTIDGRVFLNNVSFGVYADLVHRRERHRRRKSALAGARAAWRIAHERHRVRLTVDGGDMHVYVLFFGNNRYELSLFTVGERTALDEGTLHLYAARGWLPRHWREHVAARFELELPRRIRAAIDGEPAVFDTGKPHVIESRRGALRVRLPNATNDGATR
jgi:diacylglycerol kinase family enzyme